MIFLSHLMEYLEIQRTKDYVNFVNRDILNRNSETNKITKRQKLGAAINIAAAKQQPAGKQHIAQIEIEIKIGKLAILFLFLCISFYSSNTHKDWCGRVFCWCGWCRVISHRTGNDCASTLVIP